MRAQDITDESGARDYTAWDRRDSTQLLHDFEQERAEGGVSQRAFARERGVPRTTLQNWLERKATLDADAALVAFMESPVGLAFLHRQVLLLHLVFCEAGPCGVDRLCLYLRLSGFAPFVASSHGEQHETAAAMRSEILAFEQAQRAKQAPGMRRREIAVAADETFHPELCLVGIEPDSNFILVQEYAEKRDAETWAAVMREATADLSVDIVVGAADEGAGLARWIEQLLGIQKAPDVLHVQHELWRALSLALADSVVEPAAAIEAPKRRLAAWQERKATHDAGDRPVGRPPDYDRYISKFELELAEAEAYDEAARRLADATKEAIRSLSTAYHPVDLQTGELRTATNIEADFDQAVATIDDAVVALDLPAKRTAKVAKAKRVLPKMVGLVTFFFAHLRGRLATLGVSEEVVSIVLDQLVPAFYLQQVARRRCLAAERDRRLALSGDLLARARAPGSALAALPATLQTQLELLADDCAALFVRATACVEGCNGYLALLHHGFKRLDNQRLAVIRVLHNYFVHRADGTTAAERFYESPHDDLVDWLLDRMEVPTRPRLRRSQEAA